MTVTEIAERSTSLDEEITAELTSAPDADQRFRQLIERLNRQSVDKHYAAYEDIDWDDPHYAIDPTDPRWIGVVDEGLRSTEWFQSLEPRQQSIIGCYLAANFMKIGLQFENILKRGLLELAFGLPNGDPIFRYVYHEVIEEAQHSLMFQEFVNRAGFEIGGLPPRMRFGARRIVSLGRRFPELFLMFVIGGEDPIDHVQRSALRGEAELPPILERICRIHVTEEARHLSFARHYLKLRVPRLDPVRRAWLSIQTPLILGVMAQLMMKPSPAMVKRFSIPREALRQAYGDNPEHRQRTVDALGKVRKLSRELGLINPVSKRVWQVLGIWED